MPLKVPEQSKRSKVVRTLMWIVDTLEKPPAQPPKGSQAFPSETRRRREQKSSKADRREAVSRLRSRYCISGTTIKSTTLYYVRKILSRRLCFFQGLGTRPTGANERSLSQAADSRDLACLVFGVWDVAVKLLHTASRRSRPYQDLACQALGLAQVCRCSGLDPLARGPRVLRPRPQRLRPTQKNPSSLSPETIHAPKGRRKSI